MINTSGMLRDTREWLVIILFWGIAFGGAAFWVMVAFDCYFSPK